MAVALRIQENCIFPRMCLRVPSSAHSDILHRTRCNDYRCQVSPLVASRVLLDRLASAAQPWTAREQSFVNIFMVWTTHRDSWGSVNDRVMESVVVSIPNARVRVLSNSLPIEFFSAFVLLGYDVTVVPYDISSLADSLPGTTWLRSVLQSTNRAPHALTHIADFLRLAVLYRFGGMYLDTDALWLADLSELPTNFIGKIDFLKLEPSCDWCIEKRWYLANGVLSFRAFHPFLLHLLGAIDKMEFDEQSRTAIGPKFVTTHFIQTETTTARDVMILPEHKFYPIPGPDVPKYMTASEMANAMVSSVIQASHSVHIFLYTYKNIPIEPGCAFHTLLGVRRTPSLVTVCQCRYRQRTTYICLPDNAVIEYQPSPNDWWLPFCRICIHVQARAPDAVTINVAARAGALRTMSQTLAKALTFRLTQANAFRCEQLESLEYVHLGGYCNDVVSVMVGGVVEDITISAPCISAKKLLSVPDTLRRQEPVL